MPRNNHKRKRYLQKEKDRTKRHKKKIGVKDTPVFNFETGTWGIKRG